MSSISIGIVRLRTMVERVVAIEEVGNRIVRWGLIVVLAWIRGMKFTAYEAMGIQPLVAHRVIVFLASDGAAWLIGERINASRACIEAWLICDPPPLQKAELSAEVSR
jgi:Protein of unknown function, DUF417